MKTHWELWRGLDGRWYFHKRSANGEISEPSQGYTRKDNAKRAAKKDDPTVPILPVKGVMHA